MSNNRRIASKIKAYKPIDEACGEYSSDHRKVKKMVAIIQTVISGSI
jgi:hypothetical protein